MFSSNKCTCQIKFCLYFFIYRRQCKFQYVYHLCSSSTVLSLSDLKILNVAVIWDMTYHCIKVESGILKHCHSVDFNPNDPTISLMFVYSVKSIFNHSALLQRHSVWIFSEIKCSEFKHLNIKHKQAHSSTSRQGRRKFKNATYSFPCRL